MNTRRMEAESVRDSILSIAGKLDTKMYGPDIDPAKGEEIYRRSIYFRHAPDVQMDMLHVFDLASPNECYQRSESVVPQQALALSNSQLSLEMSRLIASDLAPALAEAPAAPSPLAGNRFVAEQHVSPEEEFVTAAFERILGRPPSAKERKTSLEYLASQADLYRDPSRLTHFASGPQARVKPSSDPAQRARESLVHVLFNHSEFVTIR